MAAQLEDVPGVDSADAAAGLEGKRGRRLSAERAAGQEIPLGPAPVAGDGAEAGIAGHQRGMGEVVRIRVGDLGIRAQRHGGIADRDSLRQLHQALPAAVEAHQQLSGAKAGGAGDAAAPGPGGPRATRVASMDVAISVRIGRGSFPLWESRRRTAIELTLALSESSPWAGPRRPRPPPVPDTGRIASLSADIDQPMMRHALPPRRAGRRPRRRPDRRRGRALRRGAGRRRERARASR